MKKSCVAAHIPLWQFSLWGKKRPMKPGLRSFSLEITARCNNDCRHCYINLPAGDAEARKKEISFERIREITDEAVSLGALWCDITGGEPLLRQDFRDIYVYLKRKGLLVSVQTNATLVTDDHIELFKKYPPRDIDVTVYGVTRQTYERVTRKNGSFKAFRSGLKKLISSGLSVRLKTMALRSNVRELPAISRFCRQKSKKVFRFDPSLHLRYDKNEKRNREIKAERLTAEEVVAIERSDAQRSAALAGMCENLPTAEVSGKNGDFLFHCATRAGKTCAISFDGYVSLCATLRHPRFMCELKTMRLSRALCMLIPRIRNMRSKRKEYRRRCGNCKIVDLCMSCPAHLYLESGELDRFNGEFCDIAHARVLSIQKQ